MKAVVFDEEIKYVEDYKKPVPQKGEALVRVTLAGICNTDFEISKGYMGYKGILGHEAVGVVEKVNGEDQHLVGKRVVSEISYGCHKPDCGYCAEKMYRHCPDRHTLGIVAKDGCMAEYFTMPTEVLFEVDDSISDEQVVFVEPLAAGLEILEQLHIKPFEKVLVQGDGKLGLLTALALHASNVDVTLVGKHQNKLDVAKAQGIKTVLLNNLAVAPVWDIVVEATGTASGFEASMALCKPRGVLVLKSTVASGKEINLAPIVINEITVLGSRCGQFGPALRLLKSGNLDLKPMITDIFPVEKAVEAFERNKDKDSLKVLIKF